MPLLLLIRHGENEYTKHHRFAGHLPGIHLNMHGQEQARQLGKAFKDIPLTAIYSSPLERALETASPIAAARNLEIIITEGLTETKVGKWQGRTHNSVLLTKAWKLVQAAPSRFRFPNGESFHECQSRVVSALDSILQGYKMTDIVACVFHADPIKLAVAYYLGMPLDNFQRIGCDTGSMTALNMHTSHVYLITLNQHPPFDFKHQPKKVADGNKMKGRTK